MKNFLPKNFLTIRRGESTTRAQRTPRETTFTKTLRNKLSPRPRRKITENTEIKDIFISKSSLPPKCTTADVLHGESSTKNAHKKHQENIIFYFKEQFTTKTPKHQNTKTPKH